MEELADAADLLGVLQPTDAEVLLRRMDPEDSESVRRLLSHSPDTAGGLMTSDPVVLAPDTTVAEALALPDIRQKFSDQGAEPRGWTPEQTAKFVQGESERWNKVIKSAKVTLE